MTAYEGWKEVWRPWYPLVEGVFYFCQGFYSIGSLLYVAIFAVDTFKLSVNTVALLQVAVVAPVYLKMIPLALCDRYPIGKYGRRRPYIAIAAIIYAVSYAVLSQITTFGILWIATVMIGMLAWVIADGCLDGLTVDVTPPEKAGLMQGVAWGGRGLGYAFGALVIGVMSSSINWSIIVLIIGVFAVIQCLAGILIKEPKVTTERVASLDAYKKVAKRRETWIGLAYILLASTALLVSEVFGTTYLKEQTQADTTTLGIALAIMSLGIFLGSLPMGIISDKVGTKKALLTGNVLAIIGCGLLATIGPGNVTWMLSTAFMAGAFQGAQMTAMLRMYMELSPPEIGGSMFALYSSMSNAGISVLASLTFYFAAPKLGNASGVLSVIPYVAVAILMIPFMTLYKPAKKDPTHTKR